MSLGKKKFTLKTHSAKLYIWSPVGFEKNKNGGNQRPFYCDATAGSQGQDWVTTYSYDINVVDGIQQHLAYVECGYCE